LPPPVRCCRQSRPTTSTCLQANALNQTWICNQNSTKWQEIGACACHLCADDRVTKLGPGRSQNAQRGQRPGARSSRWKMLQCSRQLRLVLSPGDPSVPHACGPRGLPLQASCCGRLRQGTRAASRLVRNADCRALRCHDAAVCHAQPHPLSLLSSAARHEQAATKAQPGASRLLTLHLSDLAGVVVKVEQVHPLLRRKELH